MSGYSGHCLCGAVTWSHAGPSLRNLVCHCDDCRRATGAPFAAFVGLDPEGLVLDGPISNYQSSPEGHRGFCATCGTRLYFRSTRWPGEIHLHVGTLAQPENYAPTRHVVTEERLPWLDALSDIPSDASFAKDPSP